jgi:heptosyltransferase II
VNALRTLVISPNWIGDAVMAQPLLALLRQQHPDRPIDVLAPPGVAPVWRAVAEVDTVLEMPLRHGALQLKERWKYARVLRQRGYADAYVLPNTIKYALIPWLAGIPRRVGYKGEMRYGLINVMHHDDEPARPMMPFYAALAQDPSLPAPRKVARPAMQVPAGAAAAACARYGIDPARQLVVYAPGAEFGPAKRWPPRHFGDLAQRIVAADPEVQIALLGSPKDRPTCEEVIVAAGPAASNMLNLAGSTKLDEAAALIAQSAALVTNDSGLMHIASGLNKPLVALYGPTDPRHTPPSSESAHWVWLHLECAPCQERVCPLGHHHCMEKLGPDMAWQELRPMLGQVVR